MPPMIASLPIALAGETLATAEAATAELSRFDESLGAEIAPFTALLLRSESAASSRIENLSASARAIFTAELGPSCRQTADLIVANTRAMRAAIELSDDLSARAVLAMHRELMTGDSRHPAGEFRREPVWIGTSLVNLFGAEFVAPRFERVPDLIDDLLAFARRTDVPRLAQIAITHAQFETIHPFTDGNGRTGRALVQAMLRASDITRNVTVPVSAGLLTNVDAYHRGLTAYRSGNADAFVRLMAEAALIAVGNARQLVSDVRAVQQSWRERVTARRDSSVWRILEFIVRQPMTTAAFVAEHLGVSVTNVYGPLKSLTDLGVLAAKSEHKLGRVWRSPEILSALDTFAERAGRRATAP
ncbi:MAG: Fic family protein [Microbacteriaceae bacterium]|nr:Fic family protein [Microbacteriaceae bacterium]